jgi:hypothetical protein
LKERIKKRGNILWAIAITLMVIISTNDSDNSKKIIPTDQNSSKLTNKAK